MFTKLDMKQLYFQLTISQISTLRKKNSTFYWNFCQKINIRNGIIKN